jgi:hypothetical protein
MNGERAAWFAFSSMFRQDPKIEALGERFGADGPFLFVGLMCEAKLQCRGGRVEGSLRGLAHDCFIDGRDRAAEILKAADETDAIEIETLDERAFVVRVVNWSRWQERFRKAESRAESDDGQERTPPDKGGQERTPPVARTGTATDTGTDTGTKTATKSEQVGVEVPVALRPYLLVLDRVVDRKGAAPLNVAAAVKACEKFADRDFAVEAEKFEHYWLDGAGQNRRMKDVAGAWRNWLRQAPPARRQARSAGMEQAHRFAEMARQAEAEEGSAA